MTEFVHLRPPGEHKTVCGADAHSVRTTGKVAESTCQPCLDCLRKLVEDARLRRQVEILHRAGQLPEGLTGMPAVAIEPGSGEPPMER